MSPDMDPCIFGECKLLDLGIRCSEHIQDDNLVEHQWSFLNKNMQDFQKSFDILSLDHMEMEHTMEVAQLVEAHEQ